VEVGEEAEEAEEAEVAEAEAAMMPIPISTTLKLPSKIVPFTRR
jgi:hypothetical protein